MELNRRRYLATATATLSTLALAGCSEDEDGSGDSGEGGANGNGGDSGSGDNNDGNDGSNQPDVEILSHEFYQDDYSVGVSGVAQNNTDGELSYVEAEAVFLDGSGTQIGDGLDNVTDLNAGRKWEFECMFLGDDESRIESYEIEVSTGL